MSPVRVVLVGAGSMGSNHARVLDTSDRCELVAVVDPDPDRGGQVAARHGARWVPGMEGVVEADAVVLASATEWHRPLALEVIAAGLPLLVEKPVCPSLAETEEVLAASAEAGVPIMCGLLERYNPAVMTAMRMLEAPLFLRAERHSPYVPRIRTGVAWDLLVHDVDLVVQAFGGVEPTGVGTEIGHFHPASLPGAEDVVEASLRFPGGGLATVSAARIGQRKVRRLMIHELDRLIEVDLLRRDVTAYRHTHVESEGDGPGFSQQTLMEVPEVTGREPLAAQLDHFLDLVAGDADADAERRSIIPSHRVVEQVLAGVRV